MICPLTITHIEAMIFYEIIFIEMRTDKDHIIILGNILHHPNIEIVHILSPCTVDIKEYPGFLWIVLICQGNIIEKLLVLEFEVVFLSRGHVWRVGHGYPPYHIPFGMDPITPSRFKGIGGGHIIPSFFRCIEKLYRIQIPGKTQVVQCIIS